MEDTSFFGPRPARDLGLTTPFSLSAAVERGALVDVAAVAALQDQAQLMLSKYAAAARPDQPCRFGKLLLLLPELRKVPAAAIEDLFFRRTIGSIPIQGIICNMYSSSEP